MKMSVNAGSSKTEVKDDAAEKWHDPRPFYTAQMETLPQLPSVRRPFTG